MASVTLYKQDGSTSQDLELNAAIFGAPVNEAVLFEAIIMQRAGMRQGTASVKTRAQKRGGGRKPWRQKGTGRARAGSVRSPLWVGGGVIHGPNTRSYKYSLPKKMRRIAITSALSQKVKESKLAVVEELSFDQPATKEMKAVLKNLGLDTKLLVVLEPDNQAAYLSARNLPNVKVIDALNVNVLDVVDYDQVLMTQAALDLVEEALA